MSPKFSFSTISGGYAFEVSNNIVMCTFSGACCDQIAQRYLATLTKIVKGFNGAPWAYLGNANLHQAATPQAEDCIRECFIMSVKHNCIADAYCLISAVGISQLKTIRQQAMLSSPIEERIFDTKHIAFAQLTKELNEHVPVGINQAS